MGTLCLNLTYLRDSPSHEYRIGLCNNLFPILNTSIDLLRGLTPMLNTFSMVQKEHQQLTGLQTQLQQLLETVQTLQREHKTQQDQLALYDAALGAVLPTLELPLTGPNETVQCKIRVAIDARNRVSMSDLVDGMTAKINEFAGQSQELVEKDALLKVKDATIAEMQERIQSSEQSLSMVNQESVCRAQELKVLEDRVRTYDRALSAVMPSLWLPLPDDEKQAQFCLDQAMYENKDVQKCITSVKEKEAQLEQAQCSILEKDAELQRTRDELEKIRARNSELEAQTFAFSACNDHLGASNDPSFTQESCSDRDSSPFTTETTEATETDKHVDVQALTRQISELTAALGAKQKEVDSLRAQPPAPPPTPRHGPQRTLRSRTKGGRAAASPCEAFGGS